MVNIWISTLSRCTVSRFLPSFIDIFLVLPKICNTQKGFSGLLTIRGDVACAVWVFIVFAVQVVLSTSRIHRSVSGGVLFGYAELIEELACQRVSIPYVQC